MTALFALLTLVSSPTPAQAQASCSLDRVDISVMVTSETRGPLGSFDAGDGENEQGENSCANYLSQFRVAYSRAKALASSECDSTADNVDLAAVEQLAALKPAKRVLGSEFPAACR